MNSPPEAAASVSLDLDDKWTYMKTRGLAGWEVFPSYLEVAVPRILRFLEERKLRITFFIVGQDAALPRNAPLLRSIARAGHEIGNHSFHHEPWLHLYSHTEIEREVALAEQHIEGVTGRRVRGFRGPGFSTSTAVADVLAARGYRYDASRLPTFLGPLARAYYLMTSNLDWKERRRRGRLYGRWRDGFGSLRPHRSERSSLVDIPVTTVPIVRTPFHLSYLIWLSGHSPAGARQYLNMALASCRACHIAPSFLLHPLDFLQLSEAPELGFFPGMTLPLHHKLEVADSALAGIAARYRIFTLEEHALAAADSAGSGASEWTLQPAHEAAAQPPSLPEGKIR